MHSGPPARHRPTAPPEAEGRPAPRKTHALPASDADGGGGRPGPASSRHAKIDLDWLMASEQMPDVDILRAELVNRLA